MAALVSSSVVGLVIVCVILVFCARDCAKVAEPGTVCAGCAHRDTVLGMAISSSGLPDKLSPSRIKDFKQCPRLFFYKSVLGISTPPTEATVRGTLAHYAFERIFDHPRNERTQDVALSYIDPAWEMMVNPFQDRDQVPQNSPEYRLREAEKAWAESRSEGKRMERAAAQYRELIPKNSREEEELLSSTRQVVLSWFGMENPQKFDPVGREKYVIGKLGGVLVHGFIDRLDEIERNGRTTRYVSDYKTGKTPAPRFQDEAFFQLEVYAALLEQTERARPDSLRLIYVKEGRPEGVLSRPVDGGTTKRTAAQVRAVSDAIKKAAAEDAWEPRKQRLCDWCYFQNVCPAFAPELEGTLPEEIEYREARLAAGL